MMTTSTAFGSTPAAAMLARRAPCVVAPLSPKPVSNRTSFEPVFTRSGSNGTRTSSFRDEGFLDHLLDGLERLVDHERIELRHLHEAVVEGGDFKVADLVAIEARRLLAARR